MEGRPNFVGFRQGLMMLLEKMPFPFARSGKLRLASSVATCYAFCRMSVLKDTVWPSVPGILPGLPVNASQKDKNRELT